MVMVAAYLTFIKDYLLGAQALNLQYLMLLFNYNVVNTIIHT